MITPNDAAWRRIHRRHTVRYRKWYSTEIGKGMRSYMRRKNALRYRLVHHHRLTANQRYERCNFLYAPKGPTVPFGPPFMVLPSRTADKTLLRPSSCCGGRERRKSASSSPPGAPSSMRNIAFSRSSRASSHSRSSAQSAASGSLSSASPLNARSVLRRSAETRVRDAEKAVCTPNCATCASVSRSRMRDSYSRIRVSSWHWTSC
jgi:hypothetical protein